jgi:pre-mRNA-splicing factor 38A
MGKDDYHKADAKALLDDRGYSGALIRGQNPALLFEKGVRDRITESYYWKEQCFGLNAATLCDRAVEMKFIGGTTGIMGKPTPFLCLAFKLLQLVPEKEIILEYLNFADDDEGDDEDVIKTQGDDHGQEEGSGANDANGGSNGLADIQDPNAAGKLGEFKYLRCLAAFYIRLAWSPVEIYTTLEPLLSDYRKIKRRTKDGFALTYMDQFVDDLLTKDRICATSLWKLPSRANLEDLEMLEPRVSPLGDEVEMLDAEEEGSEGDVQEVGRDGERRRSYYSDDDRSDRSRRSYYSDDDRSDQGSRQRRSYSRDDMSDRRSRSRTESPGRDDRSRRRSDNGDNRQRRRSDSGDRSEGEIRRESNSRD